MMEAPCKTRGTHAYSLKARDVVITLFGSLVYTKGKHTIKLGRYPQLQSFFRLTYPVL